MTGSESEGMQLTINVKEKNRGSCQSECQEDGDTAGKE